MSYKVNLRDVEFNLFDYLKVQDLGNTEKYQGFGQDEFGAILNEALKFAQNEIAPLNKISDEVGCRMIDGQVVTPEGYKEAYKKFCENGFLAMNNAPTYGGSNLPESITAATHEFFIGASIAFSMYPGLTHGSGHLIETFATEDLIKKYVPNMYGGKWAGTMCLTEPQAGSAVGDITTSAVQEGDHYKIKGTKIFISSGDHDVTENIIHLVLARVEGDPEGTKGISLFVVPKVRVNDDGSLGESNDVKCVNIEHKMGLKGSSTSTLTFGDNDNCIGYLVGKQCKGMSMMFQMMNEARLAVGLQGQAIASTAYENALAYAKERTQFGKHLIIEFPDVKRMLIKQKAYSDGMRALLLYVAYMEDRKEAEQDAEKKNRLQGQIDLLIPVCKAYCSDMGFKVTELAVQTYGGYGYCSEYPVEQYMRDVKISSIYEGTNGIQALDLVGRKLGQNAGELFRNYYEDISKFCAGNAEHAAFKDEIANIKKNADQLAQTTMKFGECAMNKNFNYPQLHAVDYLYTLGDVTLAWLLVDQAILANTKLEELYQAKGAGDQEAQNKLCQEDDEAKFLRGKVDTARYFVSSILPHATARCKLIQGGDETALNVIF
ncbi:MAG: acyl-CoA dehydrogenase [Deltaproteobacteria bacterium]|nr:acyl-CoA dehydrogenase [Deltaproteobacteria bacterium]